MGIPLRKFIPLALSAVFLFGQAQAETIEFHPERGLVEVDVLIDGRVKGRFGIDTGADRLYINKRFADKHNLTLGPKMSQREIVGMDGSSPAVQLAISSFAIGDERLYNLAATSIEMERLIKDSSGGFPDGLIGHNLLKRFYVTIDYPAHLLSLEMSPPDFLRQRNYKELKYENNRHLILVDVRLNDSVNAQMVLDYCASYTTVTPDLARRLGYNPEKRNLIIGKVEVGSLMQSQDVAARVVDISSFRSRFRGAKFEGIIGSSFLYKHKLTVDYKGKRLYIEN